ncbi:CDK2-associated and cullin domain-containing protein 1 isoform X3 [Bombina bombina]|uniref:CDK2-associated and cullin domain-containing protein 1 isoform X3 n=1 Tax=Bombina bombina TaxID=8345 RepID=UPI00235ACF3F|nr:CDK2-associated and cullin domain-containing protein 1 isoform X3 [Bombina bombina]
MDEENMEEEAAVLLQDPNHNNWEPRPESPELPSSPSPGSPDAGYGCRKRCDSTPGKALLGISSNTSKFLMNIITVDEYRSTYWPKLESAIDQLLTQSPGDYIPISYEQIYSCVYKCVCQQHSEQMYSDLMRKITSHLDRVSQELQMCSPAQYIERFNLALGQYMGALHSIVPLFIYMNKFYIETKLNRDLKDDLIKLFTDHVADKHIYSLMQWVQLAPTLFSKFIPNILPPAMESELQDYAAQDQKLQRELMQNGFNRGDQSRKRAGDELTYIGSSSSCSSSQGYR